MGAGFLALESDKKELEVDLLEPSEVGKVKLQLRWAGVGEQLARIEGHEWLYEGTISQAGRHGFGECRWHSDGARYIG